MKVKNKCIEIYKEIENLKEKEEHKKRKSRSLHFYIEKYGETEGLLKHEEYRKKQNRGLEFYIEKYGKSEGILKYQHCREKLGKGLQYYIEKYGESEGLLKYERSKKFSRGLQFYIEKYGETEGLLKYQEYRKKLSRGLQFYIEKYGETEGLLKYEEYRKKTYNSKGIEFYIEKYGETEGLLKYKNYKKKLGKELNCYIEKHGEDRGKELYNKKSKNSTLIGFINKYGEDGITKYKKYTQQKISKVIQKSRFGGTSKAANRFFTELDSFLNCESYRHSNSNGEYKIGTYFLDYYLPNKNICIEYMGDYWHCNPERYEEYYFNKTLKKYAWEIWEKDNVRKKNIESFGIKVIFFWESEYKSSDFSIQSFIKKHNL